MVMTGNALLKRLSDIVGKSYVLHSDEKTYRYRKGFSFGEGAVEAVVLPATLVELWKVVSLVHDTNRILIMQAANTGLTGGSTPDGKYDRPVILVSTRRLKGLKLLGKGEQVLCHPGASLYELEDLLRPLGREPHSVIGSSCIGASVLGGISNNSGGALVQRGPAYTEMALFAQIGEDGKLRLVNHLGIQLPEDPIAALEALDKGKFTPEDVQWNVGAGHNKNYLERVRDVDAPTPARYNADPSQLYEASGNAGKLVVFAVRLDTFVSEKDVGVIYIGSNDPHALEDVRRGLLTEFKEVPISGEYIHSDTLEYADKYGRDTVFLIRFLGTKYLPFLFDLRARVNALGEKYRFFPSYLSDKAMQFVSRFIPSQMPKRMQFFQKWYKHHLMLKLSGSLAQEVEPWLATYFQGKKGTFFKCTKREGNIAFLQRFAAIGAAERLLALHLKQSSGLVSIDVALPRNDRDWLENLPKDLEEQILAEIYCGHFLCHVFHLYYIVKKGYDVDEFKKQLLKRLKESGAQYPAEHNFGHLYQAPEVLQKHYRQLDPCNCLNPGIGKTSKQKNWE
ncbi:D-lactate dehydrogenase [Acetobacteraceae bacterium]|nr:D-lactate dehydrogenase [Acetobacteraceae bacterium]